jgi:hypothetical protein
MQYFICGFFLRSSWWAHSLTKSGKS